MAPTLKSLNYDGNPPRCGSCTKRFIKRCTRPDGKKVRELMCALAQKPVHARGVCDSWSGFDGATLADSEPASAAHNSSAALA